MSVGHQLRGSEPLRRPSVRSFDDVLLNQFVPINVKTAALARRNPGAEDKGTAYELAIVEAASERDKSLQHTTAPNSSHRPLSFGPSGWSSAWYSGRLTKAIAAARRLY